jgi:hypothetical protein
MRLESGGSLACGLRHGRPFLLDSREELMSATTMVPVTISSEARSFLDRLGQAEDLEKMIDRARHVVTGLQSIDVVLDEAMGDMPSGVVLWAHRDDNGLESGPTHRDWIEWMVATFRPEVCQNFTLLSIYHGHGR